MHRLVTITLTRHGIHMPFAHSRSLSMPGRSEHTSSELYALLLWVLGIFPPLSDTATAALFVRFTPGRPVGRAVTMVRKLQGDIRSNKHNCASASTSFQPLPAEGGTAASTLQPGRCQTPAPSGTVAGDNTCWLSRRVSSRV